MSTNQQQRKSTRTCSCCNESGHTIKNCNAPVVLQFREDVIRSAMSAPSVVALKNRRPFTSAPSPVLKAVVAKHNIETSVSTLTVPYTTHLLACYFWNMCNPAGSYLINVRDTHMDMSQFVQLCRQEATNAEREEIAAAVQRQAIANQARQQQEAEAEAQRQLDIFRALQERYITERNHIERQRQHTRQTFVRARLAVPDCVVNPIASAVAATPSVPAPTRCLCCDSIRHTISECRTYPGVLLSMCKILACICSKNEYRTRLQQHPNLYQLLAFAIQSKLVPTECRDCVLAMNMITGYFYKREIYLHHRTDIQEYQIEYLYQKETGQALETNVIYDPRVKFFQRVIEISPQITFHNMDDEAFVAACRDTAEMIAENAYMPFSITFGFKAAGTETCKREAEAEEEKEEEAPAVKTAATEQEEEAQPCCCPVCLETWDSKYPAISFGCNHEMCARCFNTYLKSSSRPKCHLCRQHIDHISVPSQALNAELFQDIRVRILRQVQV